MLWRIGERAVIVAEIVGQALGLVALAVVASLAARPVIYSVGALLLSAGQGAATAAMDGILSQRGGHDEQGWLAGAAQSLNAAAGTVAPARGCPVRTGRSCIAYLVRGFFLAVAVVVIDRAPFRDRARQDWPAAEAARPIGAKQWSTFK